MKIIPFILLLIFSASAYSQFEDSNFTAEIQCVNRAAIDDYFPIRTAPDAAGVDSISIYAKPGDCFITMDDATYINKSTRPWRRLKILNKAGQTLGWALGNVQNNFDLSFWDTVQETKPSSLMHLGLRMSCLNPANVNEFLNLRDTNKSLIGQILQNKSAGSCYLTQKSNNVDDYLRVFTLKGKHIGYAINNPSYWLHSNQINWNQQNREASFVGNIRPWTNQLNTSNMVLQNTDTPDTVTVEGILPPDWSSYVENPQIRKTFTSTPEHTKFAKSKKTQPYRSTVVVNGKTYENLLDFSATELRVHKERIHELVTHATHCIQKFKQDQDHFFENESVRRFGSSFSKYFGEHRFTKNPNVKIFAGKPVTYLKTELRKSKYGLNNNQVNSLFNLMKPTSCVTMAYRCLDRALKATNQEGIARKLYLYTRSPGEKINGKYWGGNDLNGTPMQAFLRRLGWKVIYWNLTDNETLMQQMDAVDDQNLSKDYAKGSNWWRHNTVKKSGFYYKNQIDEKTYLNGSTEVTRRNGRLVFANTKVGLPKRFKKVPFGFGISNAGFHVFVTNYQSVFEAHSTRRITSKANIEYYPFLPGVRVRNPENGEMEYAGPTHTSTLKYWSGLVAIPPGY